MTPVSHTDSQVLGFFSVGSPGDPWTHGMSPERKIVATFEIFFKGHIFPEVTVLTTPDLADIGSDREQREETNNSLCAAEELNKVEVKRLRLLSAWGSQPWTGFT